MWNPFQIGFCVKPSPSYPLSISQNFHISNYKFQYPTDWSNPIPHLVTKIKTKEPISLFHGCELSNQIPNQKKIIINKFLPNPPVNSSSQTNFPTLSFSSPLNQNHLHSSPLLPSLIHIVVITTKPRLLESADSSASLSRLRHLGPSAPSQLNLECEFESNSISSPTSSPRSHLQSNLQPSPLHHPDLEIKTSTTPNHHRARPNLIRSTPPAIFFDLDLVWFEFPDPNQVSSSWLNQTRSDQPGLVWADRFDFSAVSQLFGVWFEPFSRRWNRETFLRNQVVLKLIVESNNPSTGLENSNQKW